MAVLPPLAEEQLLYLVTMTNQRCTLPPIGAWEISILPNSNISISFAGRKWVKRCDSLVDAVYDALFRWKEKFETRRSALYSIDIEPCSTTPINSQISDAEFTLHPNVSETENAEHLIAFRGSHFAQARTVGPLDQSIFCTFFMDSESLANIRALGLAAPKMTFIVAYKKPDLYVINGYENKEDAWQFRHMQLADAVAAVNNKFLKMQPFVRCTLDDIQIHVRLYRQSKVASLRVRRGNGTFGNEMEEDFTYTENGVAME